jgi:hypothetical protein
VCIYIYDGGVPIRFDLSQGIIRTQVLYKGIWVWRTFHEEFEVQLKQVSKGWG